MKIPLFVLNKHPNFWWDDLWLTHFTCLMSQDGLTVLDAAVKAKMWASTCFKNPKTIPAEYSGSFTLWRVQPGILRAYEKKRANETFNGPQSVPFRGSLVAPGLQGREKGRGGECCLRLLCWWWSRGSEVRFVWRWHIRYAKVWIWIPTPKWWKESGTHPKCPKHFRFWVLTRNLGRQWWNLKIDWNDFAREKRAPGRLG